MEERKQNYSALRNTFGVRENLQSAQIFMVWAKNLGISLGLEEKISEYSKLELNL